MGCPPLADGVIQLKKNPTEENRKQVFVQHLKCCIYWKIVCRNRITEYGRKTQQNESGSYEGRKKDQKENKN